MNKKKKLWGLWGTSHENADDLHNMGKCKHG